MTFRDKHPKLADKWPRPGIWTHHSEHDTVTGESRPTMFDEIRDSEGKTITEYDGCGSHEMRVHREVDLRAILYAGEMFDILNEIHSAHFNYKPLTQDLQARILNAIREIEGP